MALLAEEVVEEWLNRSGYFTIRGIRAGVDELDILAIKPLPDGTIECRHVEVQVSMRPISYLTKVPAAIRKQTGIGPHNPKARDETQLRQGIEEWIEAKFGQPRKARLKRSLCPGSWSRELVVGRVKHAHELELLREAGITVHRVTDILAELGAKGSVVDAAAGADLVDLMHLRNS